jgi:hypothetical protein
MDRGTSITDACRAHLQDAKVFDIRQTRRGWFQECLGCQANTEFKYYNADKTQIAHSIEDTNCFCRIFCRYVGVQSGFIARFRYLIIFIIILQQPDSPVYHARSRSSNGCGVVERRSAMQLLRGVV